MESVMDTTTFSTNDEDINDSDMDNESLNIFDSIENIESVDQTYTNYYSNFKKTQPIITKFEKAKIIGIRAQMIADGSEPLIEINNLKNAIEIAEEEYKQKKIPLLITRNINGIKEYWSKNCYRASIL